MRTKRISLLVALVFLIGAMTLPMTAFAAGGKDTTPPTLTAVLDGETVKIVSSDDNSGVEAVYIDKTRVNSLVDGNEGPGICFRQLWRGALYHRRVCEYHRYGAGTKALPPAAA